MSAPPITARSHHEERDSSGEHQDATPAQLPLGWRHAHEADAQQIHLLELQLAAATAALAQRDEDVRHAHELVQTADRARHAFLGLMSHELRTPLNAISGFAELLLLGVHGPVTEAQKKTIESIVANQKHLLGRINHMFMYSRVVAGDIRYEIAKTPLNPTLLAIESRVVKDVHEKDIRYSYARCTNGMSVLADADKLLQVLVSLVAGAAKHMTAGGSIVVETHEVAEHVHIRVRDTSAGISPDRIDGIFELPNFEQPRDRLSIQSIELSLPVNRGLARGMGGELTVSSVVGEGTTFTLSLPRA